jgi:hypothetical protein
MRTSNLTKRIPIKMSHEQAMVKQSQGRHTKETRKGWTKKRGSIYRRRGKTGEEFGI